MEAKDTERLEAMKNCLAKWFDKGRDYGNVPITKNMLAELEAEGEAQAEISFKAGRKEVAELDKDITQHLMQDGSGNWSVESWRLKAWFKKWQAKLKDWDIKND